jgi:xylan 1,4-beta-xylosidase
VKKVRLIFENIQSSAAAAVSRVDDEHGNTLAAYRALGSPRYPTEDQVDQMNANTKLPALSQVHLTGNHLDLELEPNALVLVEAPRAP